jgi:hypothetical protein
VLGAKVEAPFLPTLNHLFVPVEGTPTGAKYASAGHVDPQVIQLIVEWIRNSQG